LRHRVEVRCSLEEFVERWAQHIPERYKHAVQSFGLFSPRALHLTTNAVFAVLGQNRRPRPKPLSWAWLTKYTFGGNPLQDRVGNSMNFVRRLSPKPV
jgi:hypothetical protein